jgi:predicted RNA-binding Zn-ribbon protein involved in translation (DUF1610 family)
MTPRLLRATLAWLNRYALWHCPTCGQKHPLRKRCQA